jgi:ParB/RepB/Spo0J family partition protein
MTSVQSIPIDLIHVPIKHRKSIDPQRVKNIAESILEFGQETPVLLRPDDGHFVLVDGVHRLEACKALGETSIAALVGSPDLHQHNKPAYEVEAESQRQKTERLRKLRQMREAAQQPELPGAEQSRSATESIRARSNLDEQGKNGLNGKRRHPGRTKPGSMTSDGMEGAINSVRLSTPESA